MSPLPRRFARLAVGLGLGLSSAASVTAALPPVPVPPENPITEPKRVLGKVLFFDEQMSMNNVVSCATCHIPGRGGTDPRIARAAGPDGLANTADDILGSPGVIRADPLNQYLRDLTFGLNPQITSRAANTSINAGYAPELFWDGRATSQFVDPQTGEVAIASGGALESQAVGPPLSSVEMGHDNVDWPKVIAKLRASRPLDLATQIPPDVAAALADKPTYPELFRRAFGDGAITARRIAFALATYQRTLISDQTPWDRFQAGDQTAMTPQQVQGFQAFTSAAQRCNDCHTAPLFTNNTFRNVGVRPPTEDVGRQAITNAPNNADRGKFKVPGLRNVGLKRTFFHHGAVRAAGPGIGTPATLADAVRFYDRAAPNQALPQFPLNQDPLMAQIVLPPQVQTLIVDFLQNALTDPRVAGEQFPFDRPVLVADRPTNRATIVGGGTAGTGGNVPVIIVQTPPMVGLTDFRVGVDRALGGAIARLAVSTTPPTNGRITPDRFVAELTTANAGAGVGIATAFWALTPGTVTPGQPLFVQWFVDDPAAAGGVALSPVASLPIFCGSMGCPPVCPADFNADGVRSPVDVFTYLNTYFSGNLRADMNGNDTLTPSDLFGFLTVYFAGCGA